MPKKEELCEQEWSHFYDTEDLGKASETETLEASNEELADLARRFGVIDVKEAKATLTLEREKGSHVIYVHGTCQAVIVQECVVSLDPVETPIEEKVEGWFADREGAVSFTAAKREREASQSHGEIEIVDESEDPEAVVDGRIDLGELVTQHISLAIPPYPHKDGVSYEFGDDQAQLDEKSPLRKNPFEALKDWKEQR